MGNGFSSYIDVSHEDLKNNIYGTIVYSYATTYDTHLILKQGEEIESGEKHVLPFFQDNYYSTWSNLIDYYVCETILFNNTNYTHFMNFINKEFTILKKNHRKTPSPKYQPDNSRRSNININIQEHEPEYENEPEPEPKKTYSKPKSQMKQKIQHNQTKYESEPEVKEEDEEYEVMQHDEPSLVHEPRKRTTKTKINKKIKQLSANIKREQENTISDLYRSYDEIERHSIKTAEGEYEQESV